MVLSSKVTPENIILNSFDVCDDGLQNRPDASDGDQVFIVEASTDSNEYNPRKFSMLKKCFIAFLYTGLSVGVQINSSINGSVLIDLSKKHNISITMATLTMTLFMVGMGINVIFCGPLTELHGRKNVVCYSTFLSGIITVSAVWANNFKLYLALRFFAGFFGAPALLVAASVLKDLFNDNQRAYALLAVSVLIGSMPSVGGLLAKQFISHHIITSLNQINLIPGIIISVFGILAIIFVKESYKPVINKRIGREINRRNSLKAKVTERFNLNVLDQTRIREPSEQTKQEESTVITVLNKADKESSNIVIKSTMSLEKEKAKGYFNFLFKKLRLPYKFISDPVIVALTIMSSYYSGSMYLHVTSFPSIVDRYHSEMLTKDRKDFINPELIGVAFTIGLVSFGSFILLFCSCIYSTIISKDGKLLPELKLLPLAFGAVLITTSSFIIYSTDRYFSNLVKIFVGQMFHGAGFFLTQQSVFLYIMELYGQNSASACSLVLVIRNFIGGCIPLFGSDIILKYNNVAFLYLGMINVGCSIVACILLICGQYIRKSLYYCTVKTKYKNYSESSA